MATQLFYLGNLFSRIFVNISTRDMDDNLEPFSNGRNVLSGWIHFDPSLWTSRECSFRLVCDCSRPASLPLVTRWPNVKSATSAISTARVWERWQRGRRPFYSVDDRSPSSRTKTDYDGAVLRPGWTENEIAPESVYIISPRCSPHACNVGRQWMNVE